MRKLDVRLGVVLGLASLVLVIGSMFDTASGKNLWCYSAPDTCYVCYDIDHEPWSMVDLDLGACDTVRLGTPFCVGDSTPTVGDSIALPIYVYSTNAISGLSLGFWHTGRGLRFGQNDWGWDASGGMLTLSQWSGIQFAYSTTPGGEPQTDSAAALMGWIDLTSKKPIPRNTTNAAKLLGTLYLVLTESNLQMISFDSAFFPPAGQFILICKDSTGPTQYFDMKLTPRFVGWEGDFPPCSPPGPEWICGDADGDRGVDIADAVFLVLYIFSGGMAPQPLEQGDADCSGEIDIADAAYLINYIFSAGPRPCAVCK